MGDRTRSSTRSTAPRSHSRRASRKSNGPSSSPTSMNECLSPVSHAVGQGAIRAAATRIAPHVRRTPVVPVDGADFGLAGTRLVFKLEFLQHAGSFKSRGAFNSLLTRKLGAAGVVAASGG